MSKETLHNVWICAAALEQQNLIRQQPEQSISRHAAFHSYSYSYRDKDVADSVDSFTQAMQQAVKNTSGT